MGKGVNYMTNKIKKKAHSPEFKFKVAIEAIRGNRTLAELCQEYGIVSSQIFKWKKSLLENGRDVFSKGTLHDSESVQIEKLHAKIGRLTIENDFLSKCAGRNL
jgi:transposase-like protein